MLANGLLAASGSALLLPDRASALFESPAQASLSTIATTQGKVKGLIKEVSEIARRRTKMAADNEDDAYVLRFARTVRMQPAACSCWRPDPHAARLAVRCSSPYRPR